MASLARPLAVTLVVLTMVAGGCSLERERARRALRSDSPAVRAEGARRLGELRATEGVNALIGLLGDSSPRVRRAAVAALGAIGDRRAVPALGVRLRDQDTEVRLATVRVLGDLGPRVKGESACHQGRCPEAVEVLLGALDDQAQVVRRAAGFALVEIGIDRRGQVRILADRRRRALEAQLQHPAASMRRQAAEALGRMEDPASQAALVRALSDRDLDVARAAGNALGLLGEGAAPALQEASAVAATRDAAQVGLALLASRGAPQVVRDLPALLRHADPVVRRQAATAAGMLQPEARQRLVAALVARLQDPDVDVAEAAARALPPGVSLRPEQLPRSGDPRTTARLVKALAQVLSPATRRVAVRELLAVVTDDQRELDGPTARALVGLGDPPVSAALATRVAAVLAEHAQAAQPWLDEAAWRSLDEPAPASAPGPQGRLAALLSRFPTRTPTAPAGTILPPRTTATQVAELVQALGGAREGRSVCRQALESRAAEVQAAALVALAEAPPPAEVEELRRMLLEKVSSPSAAVRRAAVAGLVTVGPGEAAPLIGLLGDADFEIRSLAVRGLGRLASRPARDALLRELRGDPHVVVIEAVAESRDPRAAEILVRQLREDTPVGHVTQRVAILSALGRLGGKGLEGTVAAELWHPEVEVRLAAARALASIPGTAREPRAREALTARLADPDAEVRRACRRALGGPPASSSRPAPPARAPASLPERAVGGGPG